MKLGFHIHKIDDNIDKYKEYDIIRLWDVGCDWATMEQNKNEIDFKLLDKFIEKFKNKEIIYVIAMTPEWATNKKNKINIYGVDYIRTSLPNNLLYFYNFYIQVKNRYDKEIKYELWNEIDLKSYFTDNIKKLKDIIDYNLSPSISAIPFRNWYFLLKMRINKILNNINIHYYKIPFIPCWLFALYIIISKIIGGWDKELNVTEIGFDCYKNISEEKKEKYFKRFIKIAQFFKIERLIRYER